MPCPYIAGRIEQQLFVELSGTSAQAQFNQLSRAGFRRSHHIVYRPTCRGCTACIPVRIRVRDFNWTKAWRRIMRRNDDLTLRNVGPSVSDEQYRLFRDYIATRHGDGEMAEMDERDYHNLVLTSPVQTTVLEFRNQEGALTAACLTDVLDDGYSAVYSFFDPARHSDSLGSYMILRLVALAAEQGLDFVYLGFWVEESRKMAYKSRFSPLEAFADNTWNEIK